jgi:hypothetical protein
MTQVYQILLRKYYKLIQVATFQRFTAESQTLAPGASAGGTQRKPYKKLPWHRPPGHVSVSAVQIATLLIIYDKVAT